MVINNKFNFRDTVYFITDPMQDEYLVTGIEVREDAIIYYVKNCDDEKAAYHYELSKEKRIF